MRSSPFIGAVAALALLAALFSLGNALGDPAGKVDYSKVSPNDLVNQTPKGKLHNPYKDSQKDIVSQGEELFRSYPCAMTRCSGS